MASDGTRDPFHGRFAAIMNVEGEGDPIALFRDPEEAARELTRRQALTDDDDGYLSKYHHVFTTDVVGVFWNSYDPDPRADSSLEPEEIMSAYAGDE